MPCGVTLINTRRVTSAERTASLRVDGVLVGVAVAVAVAVALGEIVGSAKNTATTNNPEISNAHEFGKADLEAALIFICSAASLFHGSPVQRYG